MTSWRRPPTFIPATPVSQPCDDPAGAEREVQRRAAVVARRRTPRRCCGRRRRSARCTWLPGVASAPSPTVMSVISRSVGRRAVGKVDLGFLGHGAPTLVGRPGPGVGAVRRAPGSLRGVPDGARAPMRRCLAHDPRSTSTPACKMHGHRASSATGPSTGCRRRTPTAGSASRSSTAGSARCISADTRKELNEAFYGLVQVPDAVPGARACTRRTSRWSGPRPGSRPVAESPASRTSRSFFLWLFGPAAGLRPRPAGQLRPAGGGQGVQLPARSRCVAFIGCWHPRRRSPDCGIFGWLFGLMRIGWFVLTIVGGAKALQGEDWKNPVKNVVKARGAVGEVARDDAPDGRHGAGVAGTIRVPRRVRR